ncbi:thiolase family protein [Mycobacterium vicinigordonae]|uniref:Thiolase family protein n=1 Tax=Mycobacterium vicinigordonae TaxID=1719132 RepID=A0A7D6HSC5_9MYCO|nr:thiolase family protein [Mycobacterium vicinigordonae]QLL06232.1 thiolase family protein [Mycobacterium vicinigordonae]
MTDETVIAGVGMHPFGRFPDKSPIDLGVEAITEALADAEVSWEDIDALYCGHMYAKTGAGQRIVDLVGRTGLPVINVETACSSGGAVTQLAQHSLRAGVHRTMLVVGIEKMPRGAMDMDYFALWRQRSGHALNPAQFALHAQRHAHEYGTTERQLALVAVKNHRHSVGNDRAMYQHPIGIEEVLASRPVVDPLRLLMLCTPNEGAAAAVLVARPARRGDIVLAGQAIRTATQDQAIGEHMPTFSTVQRRHETVTRRTADAAYASAGVGPDDLDVVELQDTDSSTEIISTEELGLCLPGQGGKLVEEGATALGGRIPVNVSGGLLSKGEPVGASGLGQVYEIVNQLRGRCGPRQVERARIGLTHALGAGGNCSVMIFRKV